MLLVTFALVIFRDLTEAILVGFALGSVLFIDRMSKEISVRTETASVRDEFPDDAHGERAPYESSDSSDPDIMIYRISGAFFFAAASAVERNNTTLALNGTGAVLISDTFNVASGWWYRPTEDERILLDRSQRLVVRITAPADAITMNSTIVFEETPVT